MAPVVALIANECLKALVAEGTKGATGVARRRLVAALRRWSQKPDEVAPVSLSQEELERLRAVARSAASRGGLPEDRVEAVVEAVIKALPGSESR